MMSHSSEWRMGMFAQEQVCVPELGGWRGGWDHCEPNGSDGVLGTSCEQQEGITT